jgi:hypothetical protein
MTDELKLLHVVDTGSEEPLPTIEEIIVALTEDLIQDIEKNTDKNDEYPVDYDKLGALSSLIWKYNRGGRTISYEDFEKLKKEA